MLAKRRRIHYLVLQNWLRPFQNDRLEVNIPNYWINEFTQIILKYSFYTDMCIEFMDNINEFYSFYVVYCILKTLYMQQMYKKKKKYETNKCQVFLL